jgi:hypothetical protein
LSKNYRDPDENPDTDCDQQNQWPDEDQSQAGQRHVHQPFKR